MLWMRGESYSHSCGHKRPEEGYDSDKTLHHHTSERPLKALWMMEPCGLKGRASEEFIFSRTAL